MRKRVEHRSVIQIYENISKAVQPHKPTMSYRRTSIINSPWMSVQVPADDQFLNYITTDLQPTSEVLQMPFITCSWNEELVCQFTSNYVETEIYKFYDSSMPELQDKLKTAGSKISISVQLYKCLVDTKRLTFISIVGH